MKAFAGKLKNPFVILASGLLLVAVAVIMAVFFWPKDAPAETIEWDLTLVGRDGQEVVLSYDELTSLPGITTPGSFFSSVGTVFGPYSVKGVSIGLLCDMVGGMSESDVLFVTAKDGYSSVYDYRQYLGEFDTFEPGTMRQIPGGETRFLLMYEQDGAPLAHNDGRPLRIAIASPEGLLTEGHWWVKWVNRIEIRSLASNE